jgi:hypothetical protein
MIRRPHQSAKESGVALITTLIMLSLVTFMAVAFLALTRAERGSVKNSEYLEDAGQMANNAVRHAQTDMLSRMLAAQNRHLYGLLVSTNYEKAGAFTAGDTNLNNVNYNWPFGLGNPTDHLQNIANLYYSPRPPVYVSTNIGATVGPLEFRFFLDLNRNLNLNPLIGLGFEPTGYFSERDNLNSPLGDRDFVGDPQWIGVLERPDARHSGNNLFLGRYAFLAQPAGKSLDLNWVHNQAKYRAPTEGYYRNHGFRPGEINLAAFLVGLNTNGLLPSGGLAPLHAWPPGPSVPPIYIYDTNFGQSSQGFAFGDAGALEAERYGSGGYPALRTMAGLYGNAGSNAMRTNLLDDLGSGPLMIGNGLRTVDNVSLNDPIVAWFGSPRPRPYFDLLGELFDTSRGYNGFIGRMRGRMNNFLSHYDRYTFYRLLEQLGADSFPERPSWKLHLNFNNLSSGQFDPAVDVSPSASPPLSPNYIRARGITLRNGQLVAFDGSSLPAGLFPEVTYRVANAIPISTGTEFQLTRNGATILTVSPGPAGVCFVYSLTAPFGGQQEEFITWRPVQFFGTLANALLKQHHGLSLDGDAPDIQIYPNNQYSSAVHRSLQVAANILEATRGERRPEWNSQITYNLGDRVLYSGLLYENNGAGVGIPPTSASGLDPGWIYLPVLPTVFRPTFAVRDDDGDSFGEVYITGYTEATNAAFILNYFADLKNPADLPVIAGNPDVNVYGVPVVIGARKGLPNFNELTLETILQLTRKLEFTKNTNVTPNVYTTNQMLILGVTNVVGVEAWNSYTRTFPGGVDLYVTNIFQAAIATNLLQSNIYTFLPSTNVMIPGTTVFPWRGNEFRAVANFNTVLTNSVFTNGSPWFNPIAGPEAYDRPSGFPDPAWFLNMTNRFVYAAVHSNRVVDFVNLDDLVVNRDLMEIVQNDPARSAGLPDMWSTNRSTLTNYAIAPAGVTNQILVSLGTPRISQTLWQFFSAVSAGATNTDWEISKFRQFMGLTPLPQYQRANFPPVTNAAAPYSPTVRYYHVFRWAANDPLVHYTAEDLTDRIGNRDPSLFPDGGMYYPAGTVYTNFTRAHYRFFLPLVALPPPSGAGFWAYGLPMNTRAGSPYSPWGGRRDPVTLLQSSSVTNAHDYDLSIKDPLVRRSDDWSFPDGQLGNVGWLGRVHRGTPWQTIYFKSLAAEMSDRLSPDFIGWQRWAGSPITHPTNDWFLANLFSVAPDANATRSLLSVNQTNEAAWTALLTGVLVLTNTTDYAFESPNTNWVDDLVIAPGSFQMRSIYNAINTARANLTNQVPQGVFTNVGQILSIPELSVGPIIGAQRNSEVIGTPYLNFGFPVFPEEWSPEQKFGISDAAYERIPQQILSLLTLEDYPRTVIYAYGQSLAPAERSRALQPGPFFRLCTNYSIRGEVVTRSVVRFEGVNPRFGFDSTAVNPIQNTITIPRVAFRLEHTERNWGGIYGTPIVFNTDGTLPSVQHSGSTVYVPLQPGRTYYVSSHSLDAFQLTDIPGGASLDFSNTAGDEGVGNHVVTTVPRAVVEHFNILQPD